MRTIFQIFINDLKNLAKSKMAMIVVVGIIIIPGIYAWLNIDSNWNPYDNTGNIPIAVVNKDKGATIANEDFNLGDSISDALKENKDMKWTFLDETTAMDEVEKSNIYGAIIIPEDFSQNLTSILNSTSPTKPTFDFYINDKKNPIAPIIAGKAAGAIQDSANQAFVNTIVYKVADAAKAIGLAEKTTDTANNLITKLKDTQVKINQLRDVVKTSALAISTTSKSLSSLQSVFPILENLGNSASQSLDRTQQTLDSLRDIPNAPEVKVLIDQISAQAEELKKAQKIIDEFTPSSQELQIVKEKIQTAINNISSFQTEFKDATSANLNNLYQNATHTISSVQDIITSINTSFNSLELSMQYAISALNSGSALGDSLDVTLSNLQTDLDSVITTINSIKDNEIFKNLVNLLQNDPSTIADFISNPIQANQIEVYPISSYGSEMAPFYSVLACWVGCTVLVAIISIDIKKSKITAQAKIYQKFLGRFLLFGSIALLQGLVIGLGDLVLQVQVINIPLFLFTLMFSSLVFALIIYALAAAFGKVGQALSIVIMVLQVAGSGGTFPIELLPRLFQTLQPFMPFRPAMNAVRETVGGFYQNDYLINILILLVFFIIALIFGLIFSKHTFETKGKLQKELESTGLID